MAERKKEYTTVNAVVVHSTGMALKLWFEETEREVWVPRSVVEDGFDVDDDDETQDLHIETWWCAKEGID